MPTQVNYPLEIGVVTHAPTYEATSQKAVSRYQVKSRDYDVLLLDGSRTERIGSAKVTQTGPASFELRLHSPLAFQPEDSRFWGAFNVDEDGVATLDSVYLVIRQ